MFFLCFHSKIILKTICSPEQNKKGIKPSPLIILYSIDQSLTFLFFVIIIFKSAGIVKSLQFANLILITEEIDRYLVFRLETAGNCINQFCRNTLILWSAADNPLLFHSTGECTSLHLPFSHVGSSDHSPFVANKLILSKTLSSCKLFLTPRKRKGSLTILYVHDKMVKKEEYTCQNMNRFIIRY